jgi:hypothetical protein
VNEENVVWAVIFVVFIVLVAMAVDYVIAHFVYFALAASIPVGYWAYKNWPREPKLPPPQDFPDFSVFKELSAAGKAPSFDIACRLIECAAALYQPLAQERWDTPDIATLAQKTIIQAFQSFLLTIPQAFESEEKVVADAEREMLTGQFGLPLFEFMAKNSVEQLVIPFFDNSLVAAGLFKPLRDQLRQNQHEMSNVPFTPTNYDSPKLINPSEHKGTAEEIVHGYLRNTPFLPLFYSLLPISIPEDLRQQGVWVLGPSGSGKSTLLSHMLALDLEQVKEGKACVIALDSKGELTSNLARLKCFAPGGELESKLVLIEPTSNLGINPLDLGATAAHTIGLVEYLFSFGVATTPKQGGLFRAILIAMSAIPNASFATFRDFLRDGWEPYAEYIKKLHPDDRDFFMRKGKDGKSEYDSNEYTGTKRELLWRIQDLTTRVPTLRDMFKAPKTLIDLGAEMDAGKVIVIDNSLKHLDAAGSEFFGRLFLAMLRGQAEQREGRDKKLNCWVYVDECDAVIARDENVNSILTKCRSQKISLTLAHQKLSDISSERVKAALRDCGVRFANVDDEATEMAPRMRTTPEALRKLGPGQFALFLRRMAKSVAVTVPNNPISKWPKMSDSEFAFIKRQMRERYCYTPVLTPTPSAPAVELPPDTTPNW